MNNKNTKLDLTSGHPLKVIILFTLPLLLGNLFQQLYNVVDSMIVGRYISDQALAAVSSSGSLISFFIALIQGISVGGGIVIARHFGEKDEVRLRKSIHTLTLFSIFLGIFMTIFGYLLSPIMLRLMGTPENVLPLSDIYFKTYFLGVFFTIMYNTGSSIFRSVGDSKTPLYYLIVASIANIIFDFVFVRIINLGVRGVALGTICSQAISTFLTYGHLWLKKANYNFRFKELAIDLHELKQIVMYGVPMGIQNSIISLSNVFIQANINSFGDFAQAGSGSYSKIEGFATMPSGSFSMALATYVSQNIGAKKYERARKGAIQGLALDMLVTECLSILVLTFCSIVVFPVTEDCGMITTHLASTSNESNKCSTKHISYKFGFAFEPCEYGGFIIPTVGCDNCNFLESVLRKSPFTKLLFPSPRRIIFVVAIANISGRISIPNKLFFLILRMSESFSIDSLFRRPFELIICLNS